MSAIKPILNTKDKVKAVTDGLLDGGFKPKSIEFKPDGSVFFHSDEQTALGGTINEFAKCKAAKDKLDGKY